MTDQPDSTEHPDPRQALRALIERGEGTSASATILRLLWLRQDHPAAVVATETAHLTETAVVIRATIAIPQGGGGSGLAAATVDEPSQWADAVERAETNAISRALDTLGYVLERANDGPATSRPVQGTSPAPQPVSQQSGPRSMPPAQPRPTPIQRQEDAAPPVVNALRRAGQRPQAVPPPAQESARDDDAHLPEYSWTTFWNTARGFGLDARRVEEILGRPANQSSPKEAVEELRAAGAWGPSHSEG